MPHIWGLFMSTGYKGIALFKFYLVLCMLEQYGILSFISSVLRHLRPVPTEVTRICVTAGETV